MKKNNLYCHVQHYKIIFYHCETYLKTFLGGVHATAAALPVQPEAASHGLRAALQRSQLRLLHSRDGGHQEEQSHQPERQSPLIDSCSSPYVIETLGVLS